MRKKGKLAWPSPEIQRTAHAIDRLQLLAGADRRGLVFISSPKLAEAAGVSVRSAWNWLRGQRVSEATHRACLEACDQPVISARCAA